MSRSEYVVSGSTGKQEYDPGQLAAGWRSMTLLATLIHRGGRPAAVAPTIGLRPGEKQYGWFPVDTTEGRQLAVVTNERLMVGSAVHRLAVLDSIEPDPAHWSATLRFRGTAAVVVRGPWVPWLTVVLCAELYGTAFPPGYAPQPEFRIPAQRILRPAVDNRR
jgi:hypothetical protein